MATRVRLPAGMLREVDAASAQRRGEARREAWPASATHGPPASVVYTPGSRKGMVADDIEALLLPDAEPGGVGASANDSLVEEMLHKAAAAASPGFNSVPWDTSNNNSTAQDYLRSVMSHMNRKVTSTDQTDADIQQIIDDPDAFIARTAGARKPVVPHPSHSLSAHSQRCAPGPSTIPGAREGRKLAQGTSFRAAHAVGRFDVSGLPDSPSRRSARGHVAWPGNSACGAGPQELSESTMASISLAAIEDNSSRRSHASARDDTQVPLEEIVDKKQEQAQEMQVWLSCASTCRFALSCSLYTVPRP